MTTCAALSAVTKRYGAQTAVADLDFELRAGERVGLLGHNGAGKSTLIKLMLGLVRASSGRVEVLGGDPAGPAARSARAQIGYLPENVVFAPSMSGREVLAFYAQLKRRPAAEVVEHLERVGLGPAADRRVGTYSKGMRQRLGLAQALLGSPRILLLDEPTTGLDPTLRRLFYRIVAERSATGAGVVLSSHALAEIEGEVDRVVLMSRGRKVADGSPAELRRMVRGSVVIRVSLAAAGVTLAPGALGNVEWTCVGERQLEIRCRETDKMDVVRRLSGLSPAVDDIEIVTPGLDAVYTRLLAQEAAE